MTRGDRRHAVRRERGAVAVETALVTMLLITIIYGVVEASFLFRDSMVVSSASRAGARQGASQPRIADFADTARVQAQDALQGMDLTRVDKVWVFRARADGMPESGDFATCTTECVKFRGAAAGLVYDGGTWAASSQNACFGTQDRLGVYVEYRYRPRLGYFFGGVVIKENTVMMVEPYVGAGACKP